LISEDLYFQFFGNHLSKEGTTETILLRKNWLWASYVLFPITTWLSFPCRHCLNAETYLYSRYGYFKKISEMAYFMEAVLSFQVP